MKLFRRSPKKVGGSPGTVEFVGERKVEEVGITLIDYDGSRFEEKTMETIEETFPYLDSPGKTWINVDGLHDTEILERLGVRFGIHPLVLEDIVNTHQRPKMEDYQDYLYLVFYMLLHGGDGHQILGEQISLVLGPNYVLSFQEKTGDIFDPVRDRIRKGKGRIRRMGVDYLAYALLDAVVDHYFVLLEKFGEAIEGLEEELVEDPGPELLQRIHDLKREMIVLRISVWPLRELLSGLERVESKLVRKETGPFLRDVYDHSIQVIDAVESFRDMISGMQDLYLSSVSNRMNEVMKVLTIIATIFVPLTFVAGIYGMNFQHMPELGWKWGYAGFWMVILGVAGIMLRFFAKKGWL
jgi:magnesium transporter